MRAMPLPSGGSRRWLRHLLCLAGVASSAATAAAATTTLWPTIPFIRGQDLCEYQDAYGKSRRAMMQEMTGYIRSLVLLGADVRDAGEALQGLDRLIDKNRQLASGGLGMDVSLEGLLKASVDKLYQQLQPRVRHLRFDNAGTLPDLLRDVREQKRRGSLDADRLAQLSGLAWGTYAYGQDCKGSITLTVHVELRSGQTHNFSASGSPEAAARQVAQQMFMEFQRTCFPSTTIVCGKPLTLVGAPGAPIGRAPTPQAAEKSCRSIKARLPRREEYEELDIRGDWNDGITLGPRFWALAGNWIYAPDLPNPTPVRRPAEVQSREVFFYCVR